MPTKRALFVGLTTLDCIYQADHPPSADEKVVATKSLLVSGGPATNAAVAFAQIGGASKGSLKNEAVLLSVLGEHPLTGLLREDLERYGVSLSDLNPGWHTPPVSSVVVSTRTGERSVVASNAAGMQVDANQVSAKILDGVESVLIDGHQMAVGAQIAQWAKEREILVVVDAGSWKPGFETVLSLADVVVASRNFHPPNCSTSGEVLSYLNKIGVSKRAITRGGDSILYEDASSRGEIEIPKVRAVDTLGAGDIFHGAFCHFYLSHPFEAALLKASRSASFACQYWGTRDWTKIYRMDELVDEEADE